MFDFHIPYLAEVLEILLIAAFKDMSVKLQFTN